MARTHGYKVPYPGIPLHKVNVDAAGETSIATYKVCTYLQTRAEVTAQNIPTSSR